MENKKPNGQAFDSNAPKIPVKSIAEFLDQANVSVDNYVPSYNLGQIYQGDRYDKGTFIGSNAEEMYAQQQSGWEQALRGTLKGVNLVGTTILGGFATVGGLIASPFTGKLSTIWDNPAMRAIDDWNKKMDNEYLPNYYTDKETNSEWYSTDNWLTANFLFDKLVKNAGYAVGAMYSGNIANAGLMMAGTKIGSALAKGANRMKAFNDFSKVLRQTSRAFSKGKNIEAAAIFEKELKAGKGIIDLEGKLLALNKQTSAFGEFSDKVRKTLVATYSSAGEASFESLQTGEELKETLLENFRKENFGQEPNSQEMQEINSQVASIGKVAFLGNLAILSLTEGKQLKYLAGSTYRNTKQAVNEIVGDVTKDGAGKWIAKEAIPTTKFGKLWKRSQGVRAYGFDPKEAGQELGQFALSVGANNYYNKAGESFDASLFVDSVAFGLFGENEFGEGVGALNSKEGIEGGILGGITGGLMQGGQKNTQRRQKEANTSKFVDYLNATPEAKEVFLEKLRHEERAIVLEGQNQNAVRLGEELEAKDLRYDYMHNYLMARIKFGRFDMVLDDIKDMQEQGITEQGLAKLVEQGYGNVNDTVATFQARMAKLAKEAENVKTIYDSHKIRFEGELLRHEEGEQKGELILDIDGKPQKKYTPEVIEKLTYAAAKVVNYDERIPLVNATLISKGINTAEIVSELYETGNVSRKAEKNAIDQINKDGGVDKDMLKTNLSDLIELSLRKKAFLEEYDEMKNNPLTYARSEDFIQDNFGQNITIPSEDVDTIVTVGMQYSLKDSLIQDGNELTLSPKLAVISKTLSGEYEVQLPNGKITFLTPEELSKYELSAENNTSQELNDILDNTIKNVLANEQFSEYQEELKEAQQNANFNYLDFINSLNDNNLATAISKQFKKDSGAYFEKVRKSKETLENLQKKSAELKKLQEQFIPSEEVDILNDIVTIVDNDDRNSKLKATEILFTSGTTESEDLNDVTKSLPHVKRARNFLNKIDSFPKRNKMRAVLITPKNAAVLGLGGIENLSTNVNYDVNDVEIGFVAQLFVLQERGRTYLVNENGEILKNAKGKNVQLGQSADLNQIVFQTMPTTSLYYNISDNQGNLKPRFRQREEELAKQYAEAWKQKREELFADDSASPEIYKFTVSRGIPNRTELDNDNKRQRNNAVEVLLNNDESIISDEQGLLKISITGQISHNNKVIDVPKGVVVLTHGEATQEFLNNKQFTPSEGKAIYKVIELLANDVLSQIASKQAMKLNSKYVNYLSSVLSWRKGKPTTNNQIRIEDGKLELGSKSYLLTEIANFENEILAQLENAYNSVNKDNLTKKFNDSFIEFYVDKNGELQEREWTNYQTYLLSNKYPDGSSRGTDFTPLTTTVAKPTATKPNSFKQRYATLQDLGLRISVSKQEEIIPEKEEQSPITPAETKTIQLKNGVIEYTIDASGNVTIPDTEDNTNVIEKTFKSSDTIKNALLADPNINSEIFNSGTQEQQNGFLAAETKNIIINAIKAQPQAPVAQQQEEALAEQKEEIVEEKPIEAKKAEIARRIQEISEEGLQEINSGNQTDAEIESQPTGSFKQVWGYLRGKIGGNIDSLIEFVANPSDYLLDLNKVLSGVKISKIGNAYSTFISELEKQTNLLNSRLEERVNKGIRENYPQSSIDKLTKEKDEKITENNKILQKAKEINAKYDAELKALEKQNTSDSPEITGNPFDEHKPEGPSDNFRLIGKQEEGRMTEEEYELFKQWHSENVPNIPFEILENVIVVNATTKAWGVFENGVAKFVKGGLRGTEYHEIFEAIWAGMLSKVQQEQLLAEFRASKGTFIDRRTGKEYLKDESSVSDNMIKERIADDFADFRLGKLPGRTLGEKIRNFFRNILDFFKSFVQKPSLKEQLFKAIDTGKFKEQKLANAKYTPEYSARNTGRLTAKQFNEFVQDMTARAAGILYAEGRKELLFSPAEISSDEMFNKIAERYKIEKVGPYTKMEILEGETWEKLKKRTKQKLRTMGISFDENTDMPTLNEENANRNDYIKDTFKVDWKKNSSGAIKFSLASLPEVSQKREKGKLPTPIVSSVGGYKLVSFSKVFAVLSDTLANTASKEKAVEKLVELAKKDATYVRLLKLLNINEDGSVNFSNYGDSADWDYFIEFMKFTRQSPEALIQYQSADGETYTAPANMFSAVKLTQENWITNIKLLAEEKDSLITLDRKTKTYNVNKEALSKLPNKTIDQRIAILNTLGIDFTREQFSKLKADKTSNQKNSDQDRFNNAVFSLQQYLGEENQLLSVSGNLLGVNGPLSTLAQLQVNAVNPNQENTHFDINGERRNNYADDNFVSVMENEFNESETLDDLLEKRPELNDIFSKNSLVLKKGGMFFNSKGVRIRDIKISIIEGTKKLGDEKNFSTSVLSLGDRFVQEINQNINGNYYILVPADSATEWMISLGNPVSFSQIESADLNKVYTIFTNYLIDDINLAKDSANREHLRNVKNQAKDLRFFKDILFSKELEELNKLILDNADDTEIKEFLSKNKEKINEAVLNYLQNSVEITKEVLLQSNSVVTRTKNDVITYSYKNLDTNFAKTEKIDETNMSEKTLNDILMFINVNYIINGIEMHKTMFGDPYQFKIKDGALDQTKRIKSFLSPRAILFDAVEFNNFLKKEHNKINDDIVLEEKEPGYHVYKDFTKTITLTDINLTGSLANVVKKVDGDSEYDVVNQADGMSWLMDNTYKEIMIKSRKWSKEAQAFHNYEMAYTRKNAKFFTYSNDARGKALEKHDNELLAKPRPEHKIFVLKPIVSGYKKGNKHIELVLDKYSQMPIYFSMVEGTNMEKIYERMFLENVGYAVVESGRKVGIEQIYPLYTSEGKLNNVPFEDNHVVNVPWKHYGIQQETTQEKDKQQTRGTQPTKIVSADLFENGEVIGATEERKQIIQKAYLKNTRLLDEVHQNAYDNLLKKLNIQEIDGEFILEDKTAISEALMYELLRREASENMMDALELDEFNEFKIPFEATPNFSQIRDIMYSMIDKAVLSPKMSGGSHVQVPVTLLDKLGNNRTLLKKNPITNMWEPITTQTYNSLSEGDKKKVMLSDNTLKFYENADGKRHMEVMVPHWFKKQFGKKSDAEILEYLNKPENQKILRGIGFRIPTQALSSIEVFVVKGFLPQYMGSTVVVPTEITMKAGSDFDIDKLNMYLKSVYRNSNGEIKLIEYKNSKEATLEFYENEFDKIVENKILNKEYILDVIDFEQSKLERKIKDEPILDSLLDVLFDDEKTIEKIKLDLEKLNDVQLQTELKNTFVEKMYTKSLENAYFESMEDLLTLEEVFDRLVTPLNDAGLKDDALALDEYRGYNETGIKNRILDRNYMTNLRHSFLMGKKWIGIAAVSITNLSLRQKSKVYIDTNRFSSLPIEDAKFLGDGSIALKHNTVTIDNQEYTSLSGIYTHDKSETISNRYSGYATAFMDIAKDDYITKIIQSDLIVGTFMFLENLGVGKQTGLFLNQPIVEEYIKYLDSINYKYLFNEQHIQKIKNNFITEESATFENPIDVSENNLIKNIEDYNKGKLTFEQNEEQINILDEFLKYAKMAQYNFLFTQATNYDTSSFRSAEGFLRKQYRTQEARTNNIISSVDNILSTTFLRKQVNVLDKLVTAMGQVFKLDQAQFQAITNDVLLPYVKGRLSNDKFDKLAAEVKMAFLDYIIQTKSSPEINKQIKDLLVEGDNRIDHRIKTLQDSFGDLEASKMFEIVSGNRINGAKSVKLKVKADDALQEDAYIGAMRELRDYNDFTRQLYYDIITVSLLQGNYESPISFKRIIPLEDYSKIVSPIIQTLRADNTLYAFSEGVFERNNFRNTDIMPVFMPAFFETFESQINPEFQYTDSGMPYAELLSYTTNMFPTITTTDGVVHKGSDRRIMLLSETYNKFSLKNDFIKVPRVVTNPINKDSVDVLTNTTITKLDYVRRKAKGDPSLNDVLGYKKVYYKALDENGNKIPLLTYNKKGEVQHVYKLINLLGDSDRVSENYSELQKSVIDNGTFRINDEISDEAIIEFYSPKANMGIPISEVEAPTNENINTETNTIYSQLGNKTVSNNVVIRSVYQQEGVKYAKAIGGVFSLRLNNSDKHFGNPFSSVSSEIAKGLIATKSTKESVEKYIDWILGKNYVIDSDFKNPINNKNLLNLQDIYPQRAQWIREQLQSGILKNKPIVYYKELKEPSHATALDFLINKYDWNNQTIPSEASDDLFTEQESEIKQQPLKEKSSNQFTYDGVTIDTDFQLTDQQTQALERLIDFSTKESYDDKEWTNNAITLNGFAGTGKTSIIGYLQKYLKASNQSVKINYLAPTHAATVELAFATIKTGNKDMPQTVASGIAQVVNKLTNRKEVQIRKKLADKMAMFGDNIFVIDELSMLNSSDYAALKFTATSRPDLKIIFMGDVMQIPEVTEGRTKKEISKGFSELEQINLTEVKRVSDNSILNLLNTIRKNVNSLIPIFNNTDRLKYFSSNDFNKSLRASFLNNPLQTVVIAYKKATIKSLNKRIREEVFNISGDLQKGEVLVGYLGYQSKEVEKGHLANSIRYKVENIEKLNSFYGVTLSSDKLKELKQKGMNVSEFARMDYYQLSAQDSLNFSELTQNDFEANNQYIASEFKKLHDALLLAKQTNSGYNWSKYYDAQSKLKKLFAKINLGNDYIYNPVTNKMELFDRFVHKNIPSDMKIEKGVDFGYGVNTHKTQGQTIKNVFYDTSDLPQGNVAELFLNGKSIGFEKHSLNYVALSRASENLTILKENNSQFYTPKESTSQNSLLSLSEENNNIRKIKVEQFNITIKSDGKMFYENGNEVTDQTTKNKVNIRKELQDGTLRISIYNNSKYFVTSDNKIMGSGVTNLGKESIKDKTIKANILSKAVIYKKEC